MKIRISAEPNTTGIEAIESDGVWLVDPEDLNLEDDLLAQFKAWYNGYQFRIGHDPDLLDKRNFDILDSEGIELAKKIFGKWIEADGQQLEKCIYFSYGCGSLVSWDRFGNELRV